MLPRLVLLLMLIGGAIYGVRWFRANKNRLLTGAPKQLQLGDTVDAAEMKRALEVKSKLEDLIEKHTSVGQLAEGEQVRAKVRALVEQLAKQIDVRRRIAAVLEADANALVDRELAGSGDDAQLVLQREQFARLRDRGEELRGSSRSIVLTLENMHLALLDAASSSAGLGSSALVDAQRSLEDAADTLSAQSTANEEIRQLLAHQAEQG